MHETALDSLPYLYTSLDAKLVAEGIFKFNKLFDVF